MAETLKQGDYYITPSNILKAILAKIERTVFDLEPSPGKLANGEFSVPALRYCQDGLKESWETPHDRNELKPRFIFLNPPYSQKEAWMDKISLELESALCPTTVYALMPDSRDGAWYHGYSIHAEWQSRKRIKFIAPHKGFLPDPKPQNGSILLVMSNHDNPPAGFYLGQPGTWKWHSRIVYSTEDRHYEVSPTVHTRKRHKTHYGR